MRRAVVLGLVGAGCAGKPHAGPQRPLPPMPAPFVDILDNELVAERLPAVAADGSFVVYAAPSYEGAHDLVIAKVDRTDQLAERRRLDATVDDDDSSARDAAMMAATAWLAELHAQKHLVPLDLLEADASGDAVDKDRRLVVEWADEVVRISRDHKPIVQRDGAAWAGIGCSPKLDEAAISIGRSIALVTLRYDDPYGSCEAPPAEGERPHVLAW